MGTGVGGICSNEMKRFLKSGREGYLFT